MCACAGMFLEEGLEHWELVNRINYLGVVYTLKAVVPDMVQRNSGRIVVTNSSGSFMGGQALPYWAARQWIDQIVPHMSHSHITLRSLI